MFPICLHCNLAEAFLFICSLMSIGSTSHTPEPIDAFISCSPRDDGWVKENIIRVLCNLPHSLTIHLNKYDSLDESNMILNAHLLKDSPVTIVICSKHYSRDPTGRLRYEREIAYRYGIKLIPIVLPKCSIPGDIYGVDPIYIQDGSPSCEFYEDLLRVIAGGDPSHTYTKTE